MPTTYQRDRFDELPALHGRVGAHRAERPGMSGWVLLLWAAVATVVLIVIGIFAYQTLSRQGALPETSFIASSDDAGASAEETADAEPQLDTSYAVLVLNGTLASGLAATAADEIVALGFDEANVAIANSTESTDFQTTTVYYPTEDDQEAAQALASAIGASSVAQSDVYGTEKQLVVVVGADRVSAG